MIKKHWERSMQSWMKNCDENDHAENDRNVR